MGVNVLSTFNGMGSIWIALDRLGVKVDKRYSSETDKYATIVNDANYPDTVQLGDVTKVRAADLEKIDLFVGGSPCQGFSFAGKQLNFGDERSKLFFEFARLWKETKEINPDAKFLLENVKMKKEYQDVISSYLGVEPIEINSALLSAQNRRRLYWTNIAYVEQPEDKGLLLKDILQPEEEIEERYYLSDKMINGFVNKPGAFGGRFKPHSDMNVKASCVVATVAKMAITDNYIKIDKKLNEKRSQGKASCLTGGAHSGGNHSDMDTLCVAMVGRRIDKNGTRKDYDKTIPAVQRLEANMHGKTNCLTTVGKDNLVLERNTPLLPAFDLPTQTGLSPEGYKLRRLTPIECERLQTVPDGYTDHVSNTQRYKMLGNGWTVDVIAHILNGFDIF